MQDEDLILSLLIGVFQQRATGLDGVAFRHDDGHVVSLSQLGGLNDWPESPLLDEEHLVVLPRRERVVVNLTSAELDGTAGVWLVEDSASVRCWIASRTT